MITTTIIITTAARIIAIDPVAARHFVRDYGL